MIPETDVAKPGTREMCAASLDEMLRTVRVAPVIQAPTPEYIELLKNGNIVSIIQVEDEFVVRVKV